MVNGSAVRRVDDPPQDPEFGPWLAQASILVVDDEPGMRNFLMRTLGPRCRRLEVAVDAREASGKLDAEHFDVVVLDNVMPGIHGVQWLAEQRAIGFFSDAILMTAYADLETAIQALRAGASDFLLKPFRSNQVINAVARCLERRRLQRENFVLRHELSSAKNQGLLRDNLLGHSPMIDEVRRSIARVAPHPTTVLLTGPSGSGKEVAARSLHALSDRAGKPFVAVNCAAIPADVIESELFGHLKGAFTGAESARAGLLLHAQGGTLFLDEIGELPLPLQSKLLRAIEDRRVRPIGSEREIPVDVRFVFATNDDLQAAVREGRFRADLYFRINVMQIELPPLCERGDDVLVLADLFMRKLSAELGVPALTIDGAIREALAAYDWPGNVRELRNLIERALILGRFPPDFIRSGTKASPASVQARRGTPSERAPVAGGSRLEDVERQHILAVLAEVGGNREAAARRLGISRKTIDRKCAAWDV